MAEEIERKFIVVGDAWKRAYRSTLMRQGYLGASSRYAVRVRIAGERAWFGVKAELDGIRRLEFEYPVPVEDAGQMLDSLCDKPLIEKTRHLVDFGGHTWEVDEFHGANVGLVVAEVELQSADEAVDLPDWVGEEVSTDARFYNAALAREPFAGWPESDRRRYGWRG